MSTEQFKAGHSDEACAERHDGVVASREDFGRQALAAFGQIRDAMLRLIQALPGPIRRAVDLQKALEITAPLAWRVFKIAGTEDLFDVAKYIPGTGEVAVLLEAAGTKQVPAQIIADVQAALTACSELMYANAGNRQSLRTMLDSIRPNKTATISEQDRRKAFEGAVLMWGEQIDANVACTINYPGSHPGTFVGAAIRGKVGFHQVRSGPPREIGLVAEVDSTEESAKAASATDFLREFCSPDLDVRVRDDSPAIQTYVRLPGLGRRASVTYFHLFTSDIDVPNDEIGMKILFCTPTAMAHLDVLVPTSAGPLTAHAAVYGRSGNVPKAFELRSVDLMPVDISVTNMGAFVDVPPASGVPRYREMIQNVLKRQGWYGTQFDVYRCRLAYPVLHSLIRVWFTPATTPETSL